MEFRFGEIQAGYEDRISVATTNEEKAAVMQWQRDAFTEALRERQERIGAIFRGE